MELGHVPEGGPAMPGSRHAFRPAISNNGDSVDWVGSLFAAFGAQLADAEGNITVKSGNTQQLLDYARRLAQFLPPTVYGWDGQSNNRALISGQSALIFDAPSAWSVAKKDAPSVAAQCWGFPNPRGAHGRFVPYNTQYWGSGNSPTTKARRGI